MLRQELKNCERYFIGLKTVNGNVIRYKAFPARCDTWDCPICARIKANRYKVRLIPLFERQPLYFYTLTFYHKKDPFTVWKNISLCWNRFRTAAAKRYGSFNYVRVLEHHHKSPYPHLHIIADKHFEATWLGAEAIASGFGYQIDSQVVTGRGAAAYISKYLTKGWTDAYCKQIRKNLRLRVVSFGGTCCRPQATGSAWDIITRAICGSDVIDSINTDFQWTGFPNSTISYLMSSEDMYEVTYLLAQKGITDAFDDFALPVT